MVFPTNMTGRFLDDLANEMNTIVETVLGDEPQQPKAGFTPRMDFDETTKAFVAYVDLPGVDPAGVSIEMEDDQVIISGERVKERVKVADGDDVQHHRVERSCGSFRRVIALPKSVNKDAITADYQHGVLAITMPKVVEEKRSRRIVITGTDATSADGETA
jgi:HSP20 family protein